MRIDQVELFVIGNIIQWVKAVHIFSQYKADLRDG